MVSIATYAQEIIPGEVIEVRDREVIIEYTGEFIPNVGDTVSIGFEVDGIFVPYRAYWIVMEVGSSYVSALNMDSEQERPQIGYAAHIRSESPSRPTYGDYFRPDWNVNIIPHIFKLDLEVDTLKFFNSGLPLTTYDDREYTRYFSASDVRFISWELMLERPTDQRIDFGIQFKYFYSNGDIIADGATETYSEWHTSAHAEGWGRVDENVFKVGKYYAQIFIYDQLIAQESFFVY